MQVVRVRACVYAIAHTFLSRLELLALMAERRAEWEFSSSTGAGFLRPLPADTCTTEKHVCSQVCELQTTLQKYHNATRIKL